MASKIAKAEARTRPGHVRTSRPHIEVRPLRIKIVLCLENEMGFSVFVYKVLKIGCYDCIMVFISG